MDNSARIIHLLFRAMLLVKAEHLHRKVLWIQCFTHPAMQAIQQVHVTGCVIVTMAPHMAQIRW